MAAPRPYIRNFRAIFGPILLFRASFDIKNEFGRSKTFRLHPSKLDFDLTERYWGGVPPWGSPGEPLGSIGLQGPLLPYIFRYIHIILVYIYIHAFVFCMFL